MSFQTQFVLHENTSSLWEFACMPLVLQFDEEALKKTDINGVKVIDPQYEKLMITLKNDLKPFEADIKKYYFDDGVSLVLAFNLLENLVDYTSLFDYLEGVKKHSESKIRTAILYYAKSRGEFVGIDATAWQHAQKAAEDPMSYHDWLSACPLSDEAKWHLFTLLQAPHRVLTNYKALMEQLGPVFNKHYQSFRTKIKSDGDQFITKLNQSSGDRLFDFTDGILSDDLFKAPEIALFISYFNAYSVMIYFSGNHQFLVWGAELERQFEVMKAEKVNLLKERVQVLKMLSDQTRYDVLKCIAQGTVSTKLIADQLGVTSATISYHLSNLQSAHILTLKVVDKSFQYAIDKAFMLKHLESIKDDLNLREDTP